MSLINFSDYLDELLNAPIIETLGEDEVIVEWAEEDWNKFTVAEKLELETEANGWSMWQIGSIEDPGKSGMYIVAEDEHIWEYIHQLEEATCDACGEDPCICNKTESDINAEEWLKEYKARTTQQRRQTQKNKDRLKFQNRSQKLKDKIERKKGGNKVKRIKLRKKWLKVNSAKIANAQKVYGGKVKSKYTK